MVYTSGQDGASRVKTVAFPCTIFELSPMIEFKREDIVRSITFIPVWIILIIFGRHENSVKTVCHV